jgi:hypothetical protein
MKIFFCLVGAIVCLGLTGGSAVAKDVPLQGKDAELHRIVSTDPGGVQVATQYSRAIKLKKLGKDDVAYWSPDGGKYITAGDYAYVWCKVMNTKDGSAHYHWVAINTSALNQALALMHQFQSGVAFYKITNQGGQISMVAFPYDTLHAISQGEPTINVQQ